MTVSLPDSQPDALPDILPERLDDPQSDFSPDHTPDPVLASSLSVTSTCVLSRGILELTLLPAATSSPTSSTASVQGGERNDCESKPYRDNETPSSPSDGWTADALFGFAERINPRRAFLFVSKVLGRHIPVSPERMNAAWNALAAHIPTHLPGPVLVIGMAETAVALGAGVHRALRQGPYPEALYLASTRHPLPDAEAPLWCRFEETHSHAPAHLLYGSPDPEVQQRLLATRSLILVDDEASTGQTFQHLVAALQSAGLDQLEHIITATLTDWSQPVFPAFPHWQRVSLLQGHWRWQDNPRADLPEMPKVDTVARGAWPICRPADWGRVPTGLTDQGKLPLLKAQPGERILVLGSSEYVWPPFLLAEALARQGARVSVAATTRSPIAHGHAIQHQLAFQDNYGLGMPNFVYNIVPADYDRMFLMVETDTASVDPALLAALPGLVVLGGKET